MCKISVVLPVYNVEAFIQGTIESLLRQTFQDFELLVLDDCSSDATVERVRAIRDERIKLILNPHNMGRAGSDNAAVEHVRGEYIAKMDGDDLCHPSRLARQVAYLDAHPDVNVVGSFMQNFGASTYLNRYPTKPADAKVLTLFTLPTGNPSAMLRTSLFREQGLRYDATLRQTEDYDFCARYIRQLRIATIPEPLVQYRVPPNVRKKDILSERATVSDTVREELLRQWQMPFTTRELAVYNTIAMLERPLHDIELTEVEAWLQKIVRHNETVPLFEPAALRRGVGKRWFEVCYTHMQPRFKNIRTYFDSPLAAYAHPSVRQKALFLLRTVRCF